MNSKNEKKMEFAIKVLNKLGVENKDIMILGSCALDLCGLFPTTRAEAHDVDVMVRCSYEKEQEIIKLCKFINENTSPNTKQEVLGSESSTVVMNLPKTIINFFFCRPECVFNTKLILENGVSVERTVECFNKKKEYGRRKDFEDLSSIIRKILY